MRLFLEAIRSCNLRPEPWGKREGSCRLELAQFEVAIVVIISTAGLDDRASQADEKIESMVYPRGQVGWCAFPSYARYKFSCDAARWHGRNMQKRQSEGVMAVSARDCALSGADACVGVGFCLTSFL